MNTQDRETMNDRREEDTEFERDMDEIHETLHADEDGRVGRAPHDVPSTETSEGKKKFDPKALAFAAGFTAIGLGVMYFTGMLGGGSSNNAAMDRVMMDSTMQSAPAMTGEAPMVMGGGAPVMEHAPQHEGTASSMEPVLSGQTASVAGQGASAEVWAGKEALAHEVAEEKSQPANQPTVDAEALAKQIEQQVRASVQSEWEALAARLAQLENKMASMEVKGASPKPASVEPKAAETTSPKGKSEEKTASEAEKRSVSKDAARTGPTGWSLSSVVGDQAVLISPDGTRHVVREGDELDGFKVRKIDSDRGVVRVSNGVIR